MLPLPNHLLNIDPEEVVRDIESDPLSEFVWSFRLNVVKLAYKPFERLAARPWTSQNLVTPCTECCAQ